MGSARRMGAESSEVRARLVEGATLIAREEGWHAVTARRLAEKVGLKRQIVHYYFGTIDDLLVAVLRREGDAFFELLDKALATDDPAIAIWELWSNAAPQIFEFQALAVRSPAIRAEVNRLNGAFRRLEAEALARDLEAKGIAATVPPVAMAALIEAVSQAVAMNKALGVAVSELETLFRAWLRVYAETGGSPLPGAAPKEGSRLTAP